MANDDGYELGTAIMDCTCDNGCVILKGEAVYRDVPANLLLCYECGQEAIDLAD